jgi:hypothetical protein
MSEYKGRIKRFRIIEEQKVEKPAEKQKEPYAVEPEVQHMQVLKNIIYELRQLADKKGPLAMKELENGLSNIGENTFK